MIENRWNDAEANACVKWHADLGINSDIAMRVYSSQLIGSDPQLVMHGGGNTSCKTTINDFFGNKQSVICVKGSGWDLGSIEAKGLPAVKLEPLLSLRKLKKLSDEDMVNTQRANLIDQKSPNPSVETLLHAFLPHSVVDHTHATPFLSLANLPNPDAIVRELFGNKLAIVPYVMPGFSLAKIATKIAEDNPQAKGLLLLNHGHFSWGKDAKESYFRIINQTSLVEEWFSERRKKLKPTLLDNKKIKARNIVNNLKKALNKLSSEYSNSFVFDFIKDDTVISQMDAHISRGVIDRGVATPDHVIRIKPKPLILTISIQENRRGSIEKAVKSYIDDYKTYFEIWSRKTKEEKIMLDPVPKIVWVEGIGLIGIGRSMKEAKTITDIAVQNIVVITDSEGAGGFYPVKNKDLFEMEYWSLEQAKLSKKPLSKLHGKVTIVTGAGGAIGASIVKLFESQGAEVIAVDIDENGLKKHNFSSRVSKQCLDITDEAQAKKLIDDIVDQFGGLDILISNAGSAMQSSILEMDIKDLRKSFEINFFSHFFLAKLVGQLFVEQGNNGQILFNISKQAVNPGSNFGAYGLPKATLMFLVKQLALEFGGYGIRINGVNADRIRSGLLNEEFVKKRAKVRGISVQEYMKGNLLKQEVQAHHVASAFVYLSLSERTTGHVITVDGGNIEASLR